MEVAGQHRDLADLTAEIYPGIINLLKANVNYSGRTAPLTSNVAFYIFIKQLF